MEVLGKKADPKKGAKIFKTKCSQCHVAAEVSFDDDKAIVRPSRSSNSHRFNKHRVVETNKVLTFMVLLDVTLEVLRDSLTRKPTRSRVRPSVRNPRI